MDNMIGDRNMTLINAIEIDESGDFSALEMPIRLEALQSKVGGYIQAIPTDDGRLTFWMDEDGKSKQLPLNTLATVLLDDKLPGFLNHDYVCGTVVITGGANRNGDTLGLTIEQRDDLLDTLGLMRMWLQRDKTQKNGE